MSSNKGSSAKSPSTTENKDTTTVVNGKTQKTTAANKKDEKVVDASTSKTGQGMENEQHSPPPSNFHPSFVSRFIHISFFVKHMLCLCLT